ncbi:TPA: hypothetical protein ACGNL1_001578 [Streptococcus agalactiae]
MDKNNLEDLTGKKILRNGFGGLRLECGTIFLDVGLFTYIVLILSIFFFLVERWFLGALTFVLHVPLLLLGIWCGER